MTDTSLGFSHADAVMVYLPSDMDAAQVDGSTVQITYRGEPELAEPNGENGYKESTALLRADQVLALQSCLTLEPDGSGSTSETVCVGK